MSWVIDGSNVLGRIGAPRESLEAKRELVQRLGQFARIRRVRVACYFDGPEPQQHFGKHIGSVTVIFSGRQSADDLIAERLAERSGWKLVTSDNGLASRLAGRRVEIIAPKDLTRMFEEDARQQPTTADTEDWQAWFSDPKNRNVF
jgi:uncharacterized protein YaiI (UPF0178 family)